MENTNIVDATSDTFDAEVLQHEGPVVVDFWGKLCGPCKMIEPQFRRLALEAPSVKFVKVQIDDNKDLALRLGIRAMPTFIIYRNGQEVERMSGAPAFPDVVRSVHNEHALYLPIATAKSDLKASIESTDEPTQLQRLAALLAEFGLPVDATNLDDGFQLTVAHQSYEHDKVIAHLGAFVEFQFDASGKFERINIQG